MHEDAVPAKIREVNPQGFQIWTANLGIKDASPDFAMVVSDRPAAVSGVFTRSRFAGPSVELSRRVVSGGSARGVVVISKNANVANGDVGRADAETLQRVAAHAGGVEPSDLVVASTGVIGRRYPIDLIVDEIPRKVSAESTAGWEDVADAIMTTDTTRKIVTASVGEASLVGVAKGVGMIEPNMATMLAFFFTDAAIGPAELDSMFRRVVDVTFNALSIDTDTSTSDSAVIFANGAAGHVDLEAFESALLSVATDLVLALAADGEGAGKVIEVAVSGAASRDQAKRVAKSIVNSPLVKTAVHGSDPNWGRIAMAIGKCEDDMDIDPELVTIGIGDVQMFPASGDPSDLADATVHMNEARVRLSVTLGLGEESFRAFGCDLTDGYVRINADYTT